ncbi:hypothetical protein CCUG60885_01989 [Mycobacteroides salmoniphilum]|uniref:Uncharacterized protein n=1 Tax=Mycobacteroides salmoniphilum TaxID=404941 RepID=A0A4R8SGB8_9MYCO|nr:hypothetical protein CCUG60885_01989 [Mycobacteroides salmoniphilum]TEA04949.1 hypothetical protein CCUG60883_02248 [Mycobacteroides salmoniphilum]
MPHSPFLHVSLLDTCVGWRDMRSPLRFHDHDSGNIHQCSGIRDIAGNHADLTVHLHTRHACGAQGSHRAVEIALFDRHGDPLSRHCGACTSPEPTSTAGTLSGVACCNSTAHNCLPVSPVASHHNAAIPDTWGVAMLVPLIEL